MAPGRGTRSRYVAIDLEGRVVAASDDFVDEFGDVVGRPIAGLIDPYCPIADRRVIEGGRAERLVGTQTVEERFPRFGPGGEICGVLLVLRDLGAAEAAQLKTEEWLASIVAAAPDVMVLLDRDGTYLEIISAGSNSLIYPPSSLINRKVRDVLPECADLLEEAIARALATGQVQEVEYEILAPTGPRQFSARAVAVGAAGDGAVLWLARDITHRLRAAETRRLFEKQMADAQKLESLGQLAGGVAHDFNNLLVGILTNAGFVRERLADGDLIEAVEDIEAAATRAAGLCHQLLAYTGRTRLLMGPVVLDDLVRETAESLSIGDAPAIELELGGAGAVECDAAEVRHVVRDLITNAAEAIEDGGRIVVRTASRDVAGEELGLSRLDNLVSEGRYHVIEVIDDGCGMSEELAGRVFEPFFSTKFRGRGLGLAAAAGIIRGHEGAIVLDSTPGTGSSVRVYLPHRDREAERVGQAKAEAGGLVLLVDDDELIRKVGCRILEAAGFSVLTASDGSAGVDQFRRGGAAIDCVIMDLTMPVLDGAQAAGQIREMTEAVPLILSSGYAESEYSAIVNGDPMMWFLQKPYRANELVYAVRRALDVCSAAAPTP